MRQLSTMLLLSVLLLATAAGVSVAQEDEATISADFPYESNFVAVLDSEMHYVDVGDPEADPFLLLHGNPTSSYLWRNVIPHLEPHGRVIAVDLIGMGMSGKPDIDYRFVEHADYLDAFIAELELENITLVVHDWGSALGFYYAERNPGNVVGIAFMEALVAPFPALDSGQVADDLAEFFTAFRTPGVGEELLIEQNLFIEQVLPTSVARELTEAEMNVYREPYLEPESRTPVWRWPNEIPFGGTPTDTHEIITGYNAWLQETEIPKLLLYAEPGALISDAFPPEVPFSVAWMEANFPNLTTVFIGTGIHFVQEDQPDAIGQAVAEWYTGAVAAE